MFISDKVEDIFRESMVIDGLMVGNFGEAFINNNVAAGITAGNCTVAGDSEDAISAMLKMEEHRWVVDGMPDRALVIERLSDLARAQAESKFGVLLGFQGAEALESKFDLLQVFWRLGLRVLGLTYNCRNALGDGCCEPENRGLTHLGVEIVRDCNTLGVVVDLSHASERTSLDALEVSEKPCIFSHSNVSAIYPNLRNISATQMKLLAETHGVMGLSAWSNFVGDSTNGRHPTLDEYVNHIDAVVQMIGVDSVGIGSDIFVGRSKDIWWNNQTKRRFPELTGGMTAERHNIKDYDNHQDMKKVAQIMLDRGYSETDVKKVIGGNFYRVFEAVLPR